jgi:hypothetical protein
LRIHAKDQIGEQRLTRHNEGHREGKVRGVIVYAATGIV